MAFLKIQSNISTFHGKCLRYLSHFDIFLETLKLHVTLNHVSSQFRLSFHVKEIVKILFLF